MQRRGRMRKHDQKCEQDDPEHQRPSGKKLLLCSDTGGDGGHPLYAGGTAAEGDLHLRVLIQPDLMSAQDTCRQHHNRNYAKKKRHFYVDFLHTSFVTHHAK